MLVFEELLEISYSFLSPQMHSGVLCVQGKADHFFCSPHGFSMRECVRHSTSTYDHPLMCLFIQSDLSPGWFLYRCNFSSSSVFTFDLCW